ncbi:MAG: DNA alkylation repair protein [Actinomycetia bacterium]|nr:DNA alkylation repair protein [Actinomycetes bacterium]
MDEPEHVVRLRQVLPAASDPERSAGMTAYMKDQFGFFGIKADERRRLQREAWSGLDHPTPGELEGILRALWTGPEREYQYAACDLLRSRAGVCPPAFLSVVEDLVLTDSWWDTVDTLAAHSAGRLVRDHGLGAEMDRWCESGEPWLERGALIHQLGWKADTDTDRLAHYCRAHAASTWFFHRKAIGWALREYAKTDPDWVRTFVDGMGAELSGLSRREATKYL